MPAKSEDVGAAGLWTNPNPELRRPPGALERAEEVVFRRPGMAEPRPGFNPGAALTDLIKIKRMIWYDDRILVVGQPDIFQVAVWDTGAQIHNQDGTQLQFDAPDNVRGQEARGNLYLTTRFDVRKLTSSSDTTAQAAGLIAPAIYSVTTSATAGEAVEGGNTVAYQAVLERTDAGGLVMQSAPSGRYLYTNSTGSPKATDVVWSALDGRSGDRLKIYRTEGVDTGAPDTNLALVAVATLTGTAPSLQTTIDLTPDNDRGELLYTSDGATNGGAARANMRPPACKDLALYQGSLFFTNIDLPGIITLRYTEIADSLTPTAGIGQHVRLARRTNGTATISNVSSVTNMQIGMLLLNPGASWSGTGPVRVLAVGATSLTMSETWTGASDGGDVFLAFSDGIEVDGSWHPTYAAAVFVQSVNHGTPDTIARSSASTTVFAQSLGDDAAANGTSTVALYSIHAGDDWTIRASHGDYFDPPIPLASATAETIEAESIPNGYRWSKTDQPEHALLLTRRVGNSAPILRSIVARDAIWMLKGRGDGIYRTSGFGEVSGWRDDIFDASTYLLHPELATVMDETIYAWTNKGAVAISDAGVMPIDGPIDNLTAELTATFDHITGADCACFAVANPKDHEIVFGLPLTLAESADNKEHVGRVFVYNVRQNAWAQWFVGAAKLSCAVVDLGDSRRLVYGTDADSKLRIERGPLDSSLTAVPVRTADTETAITLTAVNTSSGAITISPASGWVPTVGDLVARSAHYSLVIGVTDATHFTIDDATGFTTGAGTAYEAFSARLSWLPRKQGGAHVKRFTQVVTHWDDTRGLLAWSVLLAGNVNPDTVVTLEYELEDYQRDNQRRADSRALVPRAVALNTQLYPSVLIRQADARWRISGLTTYFEPATDRVSR